MQINNDYCRTKLYNFNLGNKLCKSPVSQPVFCGGADVFVKSVEGNADELCRLASKKLVSLFSKDTKVMPKGLQLVYSQANDSLLTFSKELGNNVVVRAIKKVAEDGKNIFPYVVFKEFKKGELVSAVAADVKTGELIKLNSEGKAHIYNANILKYSQNSTDSKYKNSRKKLIEYAEAIFGKEEIHEPKPVVKATEKIIEDYGRYDMPEGMKNDIAEINDIMIRYSDMIATYRAYSAKIVEWKQQYEPIIYTSRKQKNTTFKYRNLESLSILHSRGNQRFTRIIHTNSNGIETHFLIDDGKKVVANLNKKRPWLTPEKYRYMTTQEIENSDIGKYIEFLKKQLQDYYCHIKVNLIECKSAHRNNRFKTNDDIVEYVDKVAEKVKSNIDEIKVEMERHADTTASEIVSQYFKILAEKLETHTGESLPEFKKELSLFLKKFLFTTEEG